MTRIFIFIISLFSFLPSQSQSSSFDMVINNVSIIDVKRARIIPGQTLYIQNDRIVKIGKKKAVRRIAADTIIDGTGKFILPGFWDMHLHTCWKDHLGETLFPALLRYGITGVRDMGGTADLLNKFKKQVKENPQSGPLIFGAGPILDGEKPVHADVSIPLTRNNVRRVLDSLYHQQVDYFKVYSLLPKEMLDSIATYAREKKIPFAGHVSEYITPEEAANLGQKSFEHLNRLEELQNDVNRLAAFIRLAKSNKVWLCPTLIIYKRKSEMAREEFYYHPLYEELDKGLKNEWEQIKKNRQNKDWTAEELLRSQNRFENQKNLVKLFHEKEIPFLLGTDFAGMPYIYPGFSFHEEMALLSSMGIPNMEILKMASYNPAEYLGITDLYGSVQRNKIADLLLFSANPVENIENTLKIDLVIKSGKIVKKIDSRR